MPRVAAANLTFILRSNGIRFSISDLSPPRTRLLQCVYRERAAISLFDALNAPPPSPEGQDAPPPLTFPAETIKLVSQTLARFWSIAVDDYGVPPGQIAVFATEAMRRAQNAATMLEAINAETPDLVVHILAPQVEILFGAVGARSGFVDVKGLFLDLGGGSVQMTYMDSYAAKLSGRRDTEPDYRIAAAMAGESMPFGAARLIRILEDSNSGVRTIETSKLQTMMAQAFQKLRSKFETLAATVSAVLNDVGDKESEDRAGIDIYLCGGGFRGYGSMLMHNDDIQPYPFSAIGSYTVSEKAFVKTRKMLEINESFEGKVFGMSKRRRAQFPAIVAVVEALIAAVPRIRSVTFCAGGNREGALMMALPREMRESNPLACLSALQTSTKPSHGYDMSGNQHILDVLASALPPGFDQKPIVTVFGLQLGSIFANRIWDGLGMDADANASAALHDALTSDPGCPGLTHLGRAVLGLTLCARWGSNPSPIDQQLFRCLRSLVTAADPDGPFWAGFLGCVAAALASVVPKWPQNERAITDRIKYVSPISFELRHLPVTRFQCTTEKSKKLKIFLDIVINEKASRGINTQDMIGIFKNVKKLEVDKKVVVTVSRLF